MQTLKQLAIVNILKVPMIEIPDCVYLTLSAERTMLLGSTVRAEGMLGEKVGAGYVNAVKHQNGSLFISVRLLIAGAVYHGSLNWSATRFCKIELSAAALEVIL